MQRNHAGIGVCLAAAGVALALAFTLAASGCRAGGTRAAAAAVPVDVPVTATTDAGGTRYEMADFVVAAPAGAALGRSVNQVGSPLAEQRLEFYRPAVTIRGYADDRAAESLASEYFRDGDGQPLPYERRALGSNAWLVARTRGNVLAVTARPGFCLLASAPRGEEEAFRILLSGVAHREDASRAPAR